MRWRADGGLICVMEIFCWAKEKEGGMGERKERGDHERETKERGERLGILSHHLV